MLVMLCVLGCVCVCVVMCVCIGMNGLVLVVLVGVFYVNSCVCLLVGS